MEPDERERLIEALKRHGRRMKRDKKYALATYVRLGMMTPKGNLTKRWKEIKKILTGPGYYDPEAPQKGRD